MVIRHAGGHARVEPAEERDGPGLHRPHRPGVPLRERPVHGVDQEQDDDTADGGLERHHDPFGAPWGRRGRVRPVRRTGTAPTAPGPRSPRRPGAAELEAGDQRPRREDARRGHADQVEDGTTLGRSRGARQSPSARPIAGPGGEEAEVGDREADDVGVMTSGTTHTPGASSVAPAGARRRVPVPDDAPVGAGARADGDPRKQRGVRPERDAARVGVELVGVALGDRRAQPLDRVHEPLRVDRSGVLDRGLASAGASCRVRAAGRSPRPEARRAPRMRLPSRAPARPGPCPHARATSTHRR